MTFHQCSELIHFSFKSANGGKDVFTPKPMTYQDPDTGAFSCLGNIL